MNICITVIDNNETRRKSLIRKILKECAAIGITAIIRERNDVFLNKYDDNATGSFNLSDKKGRWNKKWTEDLIDVDDCELVFLHIGSNPFNSRFYENKCNGMAGKVFGYTGDYFTTVSWFEGADYLDNAGTGPRTADKFHFREFFTDWKIRNNRKTNAKSISWNFKKLKGEYFQCLPLVAILCQGYLVAYTLSSQFHTNDSVNDALKKMGWNRFVEKSKSTQRLWQLAEAIEKEPGTCDINCFTDFFEESNLTPDMLAQEIQYEWGDQQPQELKKMMRLAEALKHPKTVKRFELLVANAYLALAEKNGRILMDTAFPPQWQNKRSRFNHDWLKIRYITNLDGFLTLLNYRKPCAESLIVFLENSFATWEKEFSIGKDLMDTFINEMSPDGLFEKKPLSGLSEKNGKWLASLVHALWMMRYDIKEKLEELKAIYQQATARHRDLTNRLLKNEKSPESLKQLREQFQNHRDLCHRFSKKISELPDEVKFT